MAAAAPDGARNLLFWTFVSMRRVLREPLLHFVAIGAALFLLFALTGDSKPPADRQIVIGTGDIARLVEGWTTTWQRPPTRDELAGLVEDQVREEVLYRQALEMGLDRDDTIVRRRLRQKLEFLAEDLLSGIEPTEDELRQFLAQNPEAFRIDSSISLSQIFFNTDRRGASTKADLQAALSRLDSAGPLDGADLGDPLPLPGEFDAVSATDVRNLFGREFAEQVFELEPGRWQGPVESGYGLHLVFVRERTDGRVPALDEVRDEVRREWMTARRAEANEAFYRELRAKYDVTVEWPEG